MSFGMRRLNSEYKGRRLFRSVGIYLPENRKHHDMKQLDIEMIAPLMWVRNSTSTDVTSLFSKLKIQSFASTWIRSALVFHPRVYHVSGLDRIVVIPAIKLSRHALRNICWRFVTYEMQAEVAVRNQPKYTLSCVYRFRGIMQQAQLRQLQ